jgi:hypothetical protein
MLDLMKEADDDIQSDPTAQTESARSSPYRSALMAALAGSILGGAGGAAVGGVNRIRSMFDPVARAKRRLKREEQKELESHYTGLDSGALSTPGKGLRNGLLAGGIGGAAMAGGAYGLNKLYNAKTSSYLDEFNERVDEAVLYKIDAMNQLPEFVPMSEEAASRLGKLAAAMASRYQL